MAANRIKGIRAVNCFDEEIAKLSRQHNDSNILCLGGRFLTKEKALKIIEIWNQTEFLEGKYRTRNDKLDMI
jgi:ribose 5-phosphate isomerase B